MLMVSFMRGFTLAEVMVSVVVTALAGSAIYNLLVVTQRLTRSQAQRVVLQSNVRAGSLISLSELAELSAVPGGRPDQNDVVSMGPSAITYRATRGMGVVCATSGLSSLQIARSSFTGHRDPQPGRDEAYVFVPGNPSIEAADSWVPVKVLSVATASSCPGGKGPGITLTFDRVPSLELSEVGTPVRFTELMELRLYRSDGRSWLGARSVSTGEAIQPLLGPLADPGGLQLEYLDASGAHTTDPTGIRSIRITLRGLVDGGGSDAAGLQEELVVQVAFRNSRRS